MTELQSLTPVKRGEAPWLYVLGHETFLDLSHYSSRADWASRRRAPILKWHKVNKYLMAGFVASCMTTMVLLLTGNISSAAGTVAGGIAVGLLMFEAVRVWQARRARVGLVAVNGWTPLGLELDTLGRILALINELRVHDLGESINEVTAQLDPEATEELAKHTLQAAQPNITAQDVYELNSAILEGVFTTTGIRVERT